MNKSKYAAFIVLTIVTLAGIGIGSASEDVTTQNSVLNNEVVFSIPVGDDGIHYKWSG